MTQQEPEAFTNLVVFKIADGKLVESHPDAMTRNPSRPLFFILAVLLAAAVFAALQLSLKEWKTAGSCPSIGPVPACYLVLVGFACALAGHLTGRRCWGRVFFLIGLGFPTLLAIFASIGEARGFLECPKTASGIPMCYLSLGLCVVSWIVWALGGRPGKTAVGPDAA